MLDSSKSSTMSLEEKRELVYQLAKWSDGAAEVIQVWSRQEILQLLCVESGKDRKYTGLTKMRIIETLLEIVSEKNDEAEGEAEAEAEDQSSLSRHKGSKRQRKSELPSRLSNGSSNVVGHNSNDGDSGNTIYCKNSACRANIRREDAFCKRCSCCICYQYDDNKDPSLWLFCNSEPPLQGESCGFSCHLECAFKHEKSGIGKEGQHAILDGSFNCVSCGKLNDLLGCWRKQLTIAKETRRVDILCYRISLSLKLLLGTKRYQNLYEIVDEAVKMLEEEVGPLTGLQVKTARGIVNRLSSGPEVQRLCASAINSFDSMVSNNGLHARSTSTIQVSNPMSPSVIRFENVGSTCLTVIACPQDLASDSSVGYNVWHRKADDKDYSTEPTCKLFAPNTNFFLSGLTPTTEYIFKLVSFKGTRQLSTSEARVSTGIVQDEAPKSSDEERSQSPTTICSTLSNPSSVEDESNNVTMCGDPNENLIKSANLSSDVHDSTVAAGGQEGLPVIDAVKPKKNYSPEIQIIETSAADKSNSPIRIGKECVPFVGNNINGGLPITPSRLENPKDSLKRKGRSKLSYKDMDIESEKGEDEEEPQGGGSSSKKQGTADNADCTTNDKDFEHCVKVIRWLECEGHIDTKFRQKFLTWYSLKATAQEVRVVKVFVDTFTDDPESLAGQLTDTFEDFISDKRSTVVASGFCMKLWH